MQHTSVLTTNCKYCTIILQKEKSNTNAVYFKSNAYISFSYNLCRLGAKGNKRSIQDFRIR